jgi:hypothetical protein
MKTIFSLLAFLTVGAGTDATSAPARYVAAQTAALATAKARLDAGDAALQPALAALVASADKALRVTPPSVTEKSKPAPDRDPHAYASTAPYFWPDPTKPDGLPYVARDGQVNPESRTAASDLRRVELMSRTVETLAFAYFFTGKQTYAQHAARLLRVWFLDPATLMRPHLNFGQGVPGKNTGRAIGIIEGGNLVAAADAAGLLDGSAAWSPADRTALHRWMSDYLTWLLTSPLGEQEREMKQNHGTLYDVQVMRLALILGRTDLAREVAETAKLKRIAVQIEPDGRQPLELARTKAFSYSRLNLRGLTALATMAESVGVDLWRFKTADGRSLRRAIDFLAPYVQTPPEKWPYQQIVTFDRAELAPIFRQAATVYGEPAYEKVVASLPQVDRAFFQLIHPRSN